jgi:hypothetical protein
MRVYRFGVVGHDHAERPITDATPRQLGAMLATIAAGEFVLTPNDPPIADFVDQIHVVLLAKQLGAL